MFAAFSTPDCISVSDFSRSERLDISFPEFLRSWNSRELVISEKNASKPVGDVGGGVVVIVLLFRI